MKKICWVTSEWFADVDISIIPELLDNYNIHWIIVLYPNGRYKESYFDKFKILKNLEIELTVLKPNIGVTKRVNVLKKSIKP